MKYLRLLAGLESCTSVPRRVRYLRILKGRRGMPRATQSRRWCFTTFRTQLKNELANKTTDDVTRPRLRYLVFQEEITTSGNNHLQGYAEFKDPVRRSAFQRWVGDEECHCEQANGTADQNTVYCTKEETRVEGPWVKGEPGRQGQRTDLEGLYDALQAQTSLRRLWEDHFPTMVRYHRAVDAYRIQVVPEARDAPSVVVYWGPTGTGKTRRVHYEAGGDLFVADVPARSGGTAWFDGYDGQSNVLIDDYCGEYSIHFLKRLLDRYPMNVQVKGGYRAWFPTNIYITSNTEPVHWYPDARSIDNDAILRRITRVVHMDTDWTPPPPESPDLLPSPIASFPDFD